MKDQAGQPQTAVRRMVAARRRIAPVSGRMTAERAMRVAIGRSGGLADGLDPRLAEMSQKNVVLASMAAELPPDAVLMRLTGPGKMLALAVVDRAALGAIVTALITGQLPKGPPPERAATLVDATLAEVIVGAILSEFAELAAELPLGPILIPFEADGIVPDVEALALEYPDLPYRFTRCAIDFGETLRGQICFLFPSDQAAGQGRPVRAQENLAIGRLVDNLDARIEARLCRVRVPIETLRHWQAGDLVQVSREALSQVELVDVEGRLMARGRLGQVGGFRAVRLQAGEPAPAQGFWLATPDE